MANALTHADDNQNLKSHSRLSFRDGKFTYRIVRQGNRSIYTLSDGVKTISEPLLWAFGRGDAGQTYLFQHKGVFYESRVSFYSAIRDLDYTVGAPRSNQGSVEEAIGQPLSAEGMRSCFGCHSTGGVYGSELMFENLIPGVRCEACHGPGEKHIEAMKAGDRTRSAIFNPQNLSPDQISQEFCASCHRSVDDVLSVPGRRGVHSIRFQPYRIFNSRCYSNDVRISCTACHNPHESVKRDPLSYDAKCNACHIPNSNLSQPHEQQISPSPSPHPRGTVGCVTCHMPKIEQPGAHFRFTDHQIRVVNPGEQIPN